VLHLLQLFRMNWLMVRPNAGGMLETQPYQWSAESFMSIEGMKFPRKTSNIRTKWTAYYGENIWTWAFKSNLLLQHHLPKRSRYFWNIWQSTMRFMAIRSFRSSAYLNILTFSNKSNTLLISKMKNFSLNWLHCETLACH
jgi:hypothetical protein